MKKIVLSAAFFLLSIYTFLTFRDTRINSHDIQNGYTITKSGKYIFDENIFWQAAGKNAIGLTIAADDVELDGINRLFTQTNSSRSNAIAIQVKEGCKNITIKNITFQNFSGGGIWVQGNSSNMVAKNLKFTYCGYSGTTYLDKKSLPTEIPSEITFGILFDGGYKKPFKNIKLLDCVFAECGIIRENSRYAKAHASICAYQGSDIDISGCTIDGAIGCNHSSAIIIASLSNVRINDVFITDIFSKGAAKGIFAADVDGEVKDVLETAIISGMPTTHFEYYLDNHESYKEAVDENPDYCIEANHLKNIIPKHKENFQALIDEHKWREFRTMGRLVCHNSDKKSRLSAIYAKWVELFCAQVLGIKVKVVGGFANFYPSSDTPLPAHRDQYKKWIVGLSFGQTRTLEFVPDARGGSTVSFAMEGGDLFIFSPDVNNRYQHQMQPEPDKDGKRINLTYFLDIPSQDDSNKLLMTPNLSGVHIPTFEEAAQCLETGSDPIPFT